jgi:hypothetical protein
MAWPRRHPLVLLQPAGVFKIVMAVPTNGI